MSSEGTAATPGSLRHGGVARWLARLRRAATMRFSRQPRARLRAAVIALLLLLLLYAAWPYATLWVLAQAVSRADPGALATLVDVAAIRDQLDRRLTMDLTSDVGPLSDDFIRWLELGIRRHGTAALDEGVGLEWVQAVLAERAAAGRGLLPAIRSAWLTGPRTLQVRLATKETVPLMLRLQLDGGLWRVNMLYY